MLQRLCLIVLFLTLFSSCAFAENEFIIGQWYRPSEFTQEYFAQIASGNFNIVMVDAKTTDANLKAMDYCRASGLKSIVVDSRIQPMRSDEDNFKNNFDTVIKDYSSNPALWGYFVKDEPDASMFINLGDVNRYLQENDQAHTSFINLLSIDSTPAQTGKPTYEHYVDEYARMIHPKILSFDNYPLLKDGESKQYFLNLEIIRRQGIKHKTPFCFALQSMPNGQYRDPSGNDLRWQVNTALAYGARGIIYFKDFSSADSKSSFQNVLFDSNSKPTKKYQQITNINAELKKLAPVLMDLNSTAVYHTSNIPEGSKSLPKDGLISKIDGGEFVVGQFVSDDGTKYAMLVNKNLKHSSSVKVYFSQAVTIDEFDPSSGKMHSNKIIDADGSIVWKTTFSPGQGRLISIKPLLRPVLNWEDKLVFRPRIMINPSNQFDNSIKDENGNDIYNEGMNMYLIAEKVQKYLLQDGRVDVFMTRSSQAQNTTLREETALTRNLNCDVLFAMHSDAPAGNEPGGGCWTFYWDDEGKMLGDSINKNLIAAIQSFYPEILPKGVKQHWIRLWMIHESGCPAALTEFMFHTNPKERAFLKDPNCQDIMAQAVAKGILEYLGLK